MVILFTKSYATESFVRSFFLFCLSVCVINFSYLISVEEESEKVPRDCSDRDSVQSTSSSGKEALRYSYSFHHAQNMGDSAVRDLHCRLQ